MDRDDRRHRMEARPWREILVPVRGGGDALGRVELALQLARGVGAQVTTLYVIDERLVGDPDAGLARDDLTAQLTRDAERVLEEAARLARTTDRLATRVARGPVVETIITVANEIDADAIIVGSHKQTWLGRLLGGSVAESILRAADCAVLAVPPSQRR